MSRFDQCSITCTTDCGHCKGDPVGALRAELDRWRSGQRTKGLPQVTNVPDGLQFAAALVRAQGTEGGEENDELLREAAVRLRDLSDAGRYLLAARDQLAARLSEVEAERDAAMTRLDAAGADHVRAERAVAQTTADLEEARGMLDEEHKQRVADAVAANDRIIALLNERDAARIELEAWRPVVEAAREWRATGSNGGFDHLAASLHLVAAVDALPSTTPLTARDES